ncbi:MAG TPA: TIGR02206 family membrane protein [Candidatus Omnitrophota bacterium]|nr:TIGR02206 family membrane protein [Candidatus Omnitrophota bacterium]
MKPNTGEFITFGAAHIAALSLILVVALILVFLARFEKAKELIKPVRYTLAAVLIGNELIYIVGLLAKGLWTYKWGLPLQLCDLAIFAVVFSLIRHNQFIWEIAYFWGLGGTLQALLTPDLRVGFPDYIFFKFFLTHGCIIIGVFLLAAGIQRPIFSRSVRRIFIVTNVYAGFIALFNWLFDANYLYLCRKPTQPSALDFFGPWPVYLLGLELMLIVSLMIYYSPYYFLAQKRGVGQPL